MYTYRQVGILYIYTCAAEEKCIVNTTYGGGARDSSNENHLSRGRGKKKIDMGIYEVCRYYFVYNLEKWFSVLFVEKKQHFLYVCVVWPV